jgi:hypothetical protein
MAFIVGKCEAKTGNGKRPDYPAGFTVSDLLVLTVLTNSPGD